MKLDAQKIACIAQGKALITPELCEEIAKILFFELALFAVGHKIFKNIFSPFLFGCFKINLEVGRKKGH